MTAKKKRKWISDRRTKLVDTFAVRAEPKFLHARAEARQQEETQSVFRELSADEESFHDGWGITEAEDCPPGWTSTSPSYGQGFSFSPLVAVVRRPTLRGALHAAESKVCRTRRRADRKDARRMRKADRRRERTISSEFDAKGGCPK